jgi:hypothetical protein
MTAPIERTGRTPTSTWATRGVVWSIIVVCFLQASRTWPATWTAFDERVSVTPEISLTTGSGQCVQEMPDGTLYAVWFERTGPRSSRVWGARREHNGTWFLEGPISQGDSLSRNPGIAAGLDGSLHVAWEDQRDGNEEIYYRRRAPGGEWMPEERLTFDELPSHEPAPAVAASGRVHLVWSDAYPGNFEIIHCYRDRDASWSAQRRLTNHPGTSRSPATVVDSADELHLLWQDHVLAGVGEVPSNVEIYHLQLSRDGVPYGAPFRVSNGLNVSQTPRLALAKDGALHVVWADNRDPAPGQPDFFPYAIWYRRWLPGLGFGHEKRFSHSAVNLLFPSVAAGPDGTVNVVWEDYSHGNSEIYFRQIRPETGWDVVKTRLTLSAGPTSGPSLLADDSGQLHLICTDTGPGEEPSIRYRLGRVDDTTPVRLSWSTAFWIEGRLVVAWETSAEENHQEFLVYAAAELDGEPWLVSSGVRGGARYEVALDQSLLSGARFLKLVALSRDGSMRTEALIAVPEQGPAPTPSSRLLSVSPNPARGVIRVAVQADGRSEVRLEVFDVRGRLVSARNEGLLPEGRVEVVLNDEGFGGPGLPPGRYWMRLVLSGRPAGLESFVILR